MTRFFECIPCLLQPLAHRAFRGLHAMFDRPTSGLGAMLYGFASFLYRILILGL